MSTGGNAVFQVTSTGGPIKVTLVWSDYPSTETAAVNLVNDFDLSVSGLSGTFLGNVFSGGWSATGGSADRHNNVENIYIQAPAAGTYTVTVNGFNIPNGPQKFALVVDGETLGSGPTPTPGPTNTPTPGPTSTFTPTATNTPGSSTSTGYLAPSAQAAQTSSAGDNNGYQTSPTNAFNDNSLFAVDTNSGSNNNTSCTNNGKDKHNFSNFNFSLSPTAVIKGIQVRLDARADATTGSPKICVQISWNGGTTWTTAKQTSTLTTSEATYILGGTADTWGRAWIPGDFSNANFRVRVIDVAGNTSRDFSLDYIAVNVTYQP